MEPEVRTMQIELWDEFAGLERRMDDLLRSFFGPKARVTFPALRSRVLRGPFVPVTDVFERGGDLVLRVELPGVDPTKDVTVSVEGGELVVMQQNLTTSSMEALQVRGNSVRLVWDRRLNRPVDAAGDTTDGSKDPGEGDA